MMAGTPYQQKLVSTRPWKTEGSIIYDANNKIIGSVLEGWGDYDAAYVTGYNECSEKMITDLKAARAVVEAARRVEKDLREVINPRIRTAGVHPPDLCQKDLAQALADYDKAVTG